MRLLVPAASAALIVVVALSAAAAVPAVDPTSAAKSALARSGEPAVFGVVSASRTATRPGVDTAPASSTQVAPRGRFTWPLSPRPSVVRRFEPPRDRYSPGHRGVDLMAAVGQPVLSAGEGVVAFSGVIAGRGVITVRHTGGLRTTYEPVDDPLASGTVVDLGSRIGIVSPIPGHCVPITCLHWGAISGQTYRDPLSLLGFGHPILLPLG